MTDTAAGRRSLGYGAAVAALLLWGGQAVIGKGVDLDPLPLVFYRIWIAVFWSIGILYATGGRLSVATVRRCIPGGVAFGMDLVLFFTALKLTTVANTTERPPRSSTRALTAPGVRTRRPMGMGGQPRP